MSWPGFGFMLAIVAVLGTGCASTAAPEAAPRAVRAIPDGARQARLRLRAHDIAGALARLEPAMAFEASEPERTWLLAHVLAGAERGPEVRRRIRRMPRGGFRTALLASLTEDIDEARAWVARGGEHGKDPWVRLVAAYLAAEAGQPYAAMAWARTACGLGVRFVDVDALLVQARAHLEVGELEAAARAARCARQLEPTDVRAHLVIAGAARRAGDVPVAIRALVAAMEIVPENQSYPRALAQLLRRFRDPAHAALIDANLQTASCFSTPEHLALRGLVAERRGDTGEAVRAYRDALAGGAVPSPVDRDLRRLLAKEGRFTDAVTLLLDSMPRPLREAPENVLRDRWQRLEDAVRSAGTVEADEASRFELAHALRGVGALEEARAALAGVTDARARALDERIAAHLAFEDALEDELEGGFEQSHRKLEPPSFDTWLRRMAAHARVHLPADEAAAFQPPWRGVRRFPVVGSWLDHSAGTASGAVRHFRSYGRFLVLGQRTGQPTEAIALSLGYLAPEHCIRTRGVQLRHDVAVGFDRRLSSWLDQTGAALGGACLPDGIWIDADAARQGEHEMRRGLDLDPARLDLVLQAPRHLAPDGPGGLFGMGERSGVGARLVARYLARRPGWVWGSLDTLTAHEFAHLVELKRHLPIMRGLPATIGLLASQGLSIHNVELELERRAQLGAIAESADPDLALAEMVLTIPDRSREPEVHAAGYELAVRGIVIHVWQHPDRFPQIDRRYRILPQLDLLTNDQIRAAARSVLGGA